MSKGWGKTVPNISKFKKAVPDDTKELLENLQTIAANWGHVSKIGVVKVHRAIVVDLGGMANFSGKPDFYIPVKPAQIENAEKAVKALVAKVESKKPIIEKDASDLFVLLETKKK